MQTLFDRVTVSKDSAFSLKNLLDDALRHIDALLLLGEPTDQWCSLLVFFIVSKLYRETREHSQVLE